MSQSYSHFNIHVLMNWSNNTKFPTICKVTNFFVEPIIISSCKVNIMKKSLCYEIKKCGKGFSYILVEGHYFISL